MTKLTADLVMSAYAAGIFPMAEAAETESVFWVDPERRGIIPLEGFHVPKRLARTVRADRFQVTCDKAFADVIKGCAEPAEGRESTWINSTITDLFLDLFERGTAHSVECWQEGELVGGLYGLALRGAFFGESMFSRRADASKVALAHLVARLKAGGFSLLDTQFVTAHLTQFGAVEIPRTTYHRLLGKAMSDLGDFYALPSSVSGARAMQSITQMS